jgi:hypothetical protein
MAMTLSFLLAVALCSGAAAQPETPATDPPDSVLFIGNSTTYWNGGVEQQVRDLVAAEDPPRHIVVVASTDAGATLRRLYRLREPLDEIREGDHDAVVLQGDIPEAYDATVTPFLDHARLFDAEIKGSGAETVFFMAWPYGHREWIDLDGIVDAHRQVEAELGAKIAPVGVAMENALAERPDLAMLGDDREHPTRAGTYLAAATIYATLFDRSPEGLAFTPRVIGDDITPDDAAFLQRIAWQTLLEWQAGSAQ